MMARYALYGIVLEAAFPFVSHLPRVEAEPHVVFEVASDGFVPGSDEPGVEVSFRPGVDGEDELVFKSVGVFTLQSSSIRCRPIGPGREPLIEIALLGIVLAFWLERCGIPMLHGSAVVLGQEAVAFLGANGQGKTALAASFTKAGYQLLTDDLLGLETEGGGVRARPGYPQFRMWPELAEELRGGLQGLAKVHHGLEKRLVPVKELEKEGRFSSETCPLSRIYLLDRLDANQLELSPLTSRDSLIELVRFSFLAKLVADAGLEGSRLETLLKVAEAVPVRRLTYPSGYEHLPAVRDAILEDLQSGPSRSV